MRVAAVDVGTNSVRLLVADADQGGMQPVERHMTITRLGYGVDATGHLDDAALARTLECIRRYRDRWNELRADRVRIAATSAVRDATDRHRFFAGVVELTGVHPDVLSGDTEAATAFLGATSAVAVDPPVLVVDIGGGSTELILGSTRAELMASRQLGCVRLTERALHTDPPTMAELEAAQVLVDAELDAVATLFDPTTANSLVGVAGTVTTVAALHLGLQTYEPERIHGTRVPLADVVALCEQLCGMTVAQRAALGPMAPGREDVIAGGAVILRRVMERFGFSEVVVSEADILDGLALDLARAA